MTMTTMMKKTDAQSVPPTVPALPTRDEYRDGMNKLREQLDCPVLSVDEQALADTLASYPPLRATETVIPDDWAIDQRKASKKRQSVAEFLKAQHREDLLKRMPRFEQETTDALYEYRRDIAGLEFRLMITNWILAGSIIVAVLMSLV